MLPAAGLPTVSAVPAREAGSQPRLVAAGAGADEVGRWRVKTMASGRYALTWRSPRMLPGTDARPEFRIGDRLLGVPEVSADRRTLSLTVGPAAVPDPADVDVVWSGRVLDHRAQPASEVEAAPYVAPGAGRSLGTDPGLPGPHAVVTSDYRLRPTAIRGMPAKVEMVGHVVRPEDSSRKRPLVVFLHGWHNPCFGDPTEQPRSWPCSDGMSPVPSHLGYDYMQRLLARQGYVTVSISANGINAQDYRHDDGGAGARAALVLRHLATWVTWVDEGRYAVDLRKVVLVGHSRGGEGVNRAALTTSQSAPYRFVGQVLIGSTNFARQATAYIPTVSVLPYCDGDVVDLQGQSYTDIARDLTTDDTALRSSVLVMGANHNYFNTEWTPGLSVAPSVDDWSGHGRPDRMCGRRHPARLTAAEQRAVGKTYIAGAVRLLADRDTSALPMFDGSNVEIPSAGDADVRTHAIGGNRELRRPGRDVALGPTSGATTRLCVGRSESARSSTCGHGVLAVRTPHWIMDSPDTRGVPMPPAFEMRWTASGASGGLTFRNPLDLGAAAHLDLRTVVDPTLGGVGLKVRLYDEDGGHSALLTPTDAGRLPALPGAYPLGKRWAQTLRVPLAGAAGVDLGAVTRVDLVAHSADGRVWVLDLAAVRPGLLGVPPRRLPHVTVHDVRVLEGDGPGDATLRVPYSISGQLREPARFVALALNTATSTMLPPKTVDLVAGQSSGTFELSYTPNTRDDLPVPISLTAVAVRGVMTNRYRATARIIDDDPSPRVRVQRVASPIAEGTTARWRVTLSEPVGYHAQVIGRVVAGSVSVPRVTVGDVPARWREDHIYRTPPLSTPLHRADVDSYGAIPAGRTTTTLAIPMRRDGVREGREAVSVRVRLPRLAEPVVRTVYVTD